MSTITVSEIVSAYGAYYEKAGQNKNRILAMLSQGIELPKHCTKIKTDDTVYKLSQLTINNLVQAFKKDWSPKGTPAFTPNELKLYQLKVDLELYPDEIEATWLGFLASENVSRAEWPLIKFLLEHPEQGILSQIQEDMEMFEYGKGEYEAPPAGATPGVTGKSMDGVIKQLQAGVDNETMNSIDIGTLDKDQIFDQVEKFVDNIDEIYQTKAMNVFMSPYWWKMYRRDKRAQAFYSFSSEAEINNLSESIDFSPQKVIGVPALSGRNVIFATPKKNFFHLTKKSIDRSKIKVEEYRRNVSLLADWWEGIGFGINAIVWTNLQKDTGSPE